MEKYLFCLASFDLRIPTRPAPRSSSPGWLAACRASLARQHASFALRVVHVRVWYVHACGGSGPSFLPSSCHSSRRHFPSCSPVASGRRVCRILFQMTRTCLKRLAPLRSRLAAEESLAGNRSAKLTCLTSGESDRLDCFHALDRERGSPVHWLSFSGAPDSHCARLIFQNGWNLKAPLRGTNGITRNRPTSASSRANSEELLRPASASNTSG